MYQQVISAPARNVTAAGVYLLFDPTAIPVELTVLQDIAAVGVRWFQLRAKHCASDQRLGWARQVRALLPDDTVLICNDDVRAAAACDGVHLGPEDLSPAAARARLGPHAWIGASCDDPARANNDVFATADYFGVGTWRPTATKPDAGAPITADVLRAFVRAAKRPVFAIGGIRLDDLPEIAATGVAGVAVSSAIWQARDPVAEAERFVSRWQELMT